MKNSIVKFVLCALLLLCLCEGAPVWYRTVAPTREDPVPEDPLTSEVADPDARRETNGATWTYRSPYRTVTNRVAKTEYLNGKNRLMTSTSENIIGEGSKCEMCFGSMCFEEDCPYNNPPSDTKQPEEPKQPEVTETEAKSLLMNWMKMTGMDPSMFQWQNESAALPVVKETNWVMATHALAHIWPGMSKKRVYVRWAKWVLQIAEETNWTMEANLPGHGQDIEMVKSNLQHPLLQNLDAAPEGGDVSVVKPKPANPQTGLYPPPERTPLVFSVPKDVDVPVAESEPANPQAGGMKFAPPK